MKTFSRYHNWKTRIFELGTKLHTNGYYCVMSQTTDLSYASVRFFSEYYIYENGFSTKSIVLCSFWKLISPLEIDFPIHLFQSNLYKNEIQTSQMGNSKNSYRYT